MYLVNKDMSGKLISGICAGCGRIFQFEDTPEGRRVEKAFETHECKREDCLPLPQMNEYDQLLSIAATAAEVAR